MKKIRIALDITVKNESKLLRNNLLYHYYLGVNKVYLYEDGSEDNTLATILDLPFVEVNFSVAPEKYKHINEYKEFVEKAATHHVARQNLNTKFSIEKARSEGYDWLISLDADELICPDITRSYPLQLHDFYKSIPFDIELVRSQTLEVVQMDRHYSNVFAEAKFFKIKSPSHRFWRLAYDPFQKRFFRTNGFYGQDMGKSSLRLRADAKPQTTHKFIRRDGSPLKREWRGFLLHYHCYNFEDFIRKYKNFSTHPNIYLSGNPIESIKRLWRDIVNNHNFDNNYLKRYYKLWIAFNKLHIMYLQSRFRSLMVKRPSPIIKIDTIKYIFDKNIKHIK